MIHSSDFKKILKWRLKMKKFIEAAEKKSNPGEPEEEFVLTEEQKANLKEQEMQDIINHVRPD